MPKIKPVLKGGDPPPPVTPEKCVPEDHVLLRGGYRACHCTCAECWDGKGCICPVCQCEDAVG